MFKHIDQMNKEMEENRANAFKGFDERNDRFEIRDDGDFGMIQMDDMSKQFDDDWNRIGGGLGFKTAGGYGDRLEYAGK